MPSVGLLDPDRMGDGRSIDQVAVDLAELAFRSLVARLWWVRREHQARDPQLPVIQEAPDLVDGLLEPAQAHDAVQAGVDRDDQLADRVQHVDGDQVQLRCGVDDDQVIVVLDVVQRRS